MFNLLSYNLQKLYRRLDAWPKAWAIVACGYWVDALSWELATRGGKQVPRRLESRLVMTLNKERRRRTRSATQGIAEAAPLSSGGPLGLARGRLFDSGVAFAQDDKRQLSVASSQ